MHWAGCSSQMIRKYKIQHRDSTGWNGQCRTAATMPPTGWVRNISVGRTHRKIQNAQRSMCAWLPNRKIPMRSICWESSISAATACRRTRMLPTTGSRKRRRRDTTMQDFFMDRIERPEPPNVLLSATRLLYHLGKIFSIPCACAAKQRRPDRPQTPCQAASDAHGRRTQGGRSRAGADEQHHVDGLVARFKTCTAIGKENKMITF